MKEQIKQAIIDSSVEGHVDLDDLTNKLLNLHIVMLSDRALKVMKKDVAMRIVFFEKYKEDGMKKEFEDILKRIELELSNRH